jgi:type I restriction-modification system DNA methylase subunit
MPDHRQVRLCQARLTMYGQELNDESYAICKADMLIKGQDVANIIAGNTLSEDGLPHAKFDYMLSNPPFGVEWKKVEKAVRQEYESQGYNGCFGPGLAAHSTMSKQALESEKVRSGLKDVLLGPAMLYEALRSKGENPIAAE